MFTFNARNDGKAVAVVFTQRKILNTRRAVMIIIGIIIAVFGLLLIVSFMISRIKCRTETKAVIVKIIEKKSYHRGRTIIDCTPVFTYTVNGKEYTSKAESSTSNPKKYFVGQEVIVFTDANDPGVVRFGSNTGFGVAGAVIALLGIFVIVLCFM